MKKINFSINIIELKYRMLYTLISFFIIFLICFIFRVELFFLISKAFLIYEEGFIYTSVLDPIFIYLKNAIVFSVLFVFPYTIYLIGFFFFKAFTNFYTFFYFYYFFTLYIILSIILIFFFSLILPIFFQFLLTFQRINITDIFKLELQATLNQYYNLFVNFVLFYFLISLFPTIILLLTINNILNKSFITTYNFRKYLYLFVLISFLIFAPPDFFLQILIFPSIIVFLELLLYIIFFFYKLYYLN